MIFVQEVLAHITWYHHINLYWLLGTSVQKKMDLASRFLFSFGIELYEEQREPILLVVTERKSPPSAQDWCFLAAYCTGYLEHPFQKNKLLMTRARVSTQLFPACFERIYKEAGTISRSLPL